MGFDPISRIFYTTTNVPSALTFNNTIWLMNNNQTEPIYFDPLDPATSRTFWVYNEFGSSLELSLSYIDNPGYGHYETEPLPLNWLIDYPS